MGKYWNPAPVASEFKVESGAFPGERFDFQALNFPFDALAKPGDGFMVGFEKIPKEKFASFRVMCSKKSKEYGFGISVKTVAGKGLWVVRR